MAWGRAACGVGGVGVLAWARPAKINVTGVCLMVSVSPPPRHWDTALGVVLTGTWRHHKLVYHTERVTALGHCFNFVLVAITS